MNWLLVTTVVVLLFVFLYAWLRQGSQLTSLEDFQARWRQVDIEAFANLVDASEENFLRERLPQREYRMIQRERLLAAREYLSRVGQNAQLMIQAGQIIQRHNTGEEAVRAQRHVDAAIQLRNAVFLTRCTLTLRILTPSVDSSFEKVLRLYGDAAHSFENVLNPAVAAVKM